MDEQKLLLSWRVKPVLQWCSKFALVSDLHEIDYAVRDLEAAYRRVAMPTERSYWLASSATKALRSSQVSGAIDPKSDRALILPRDEPVKGSENRRIIAPIFVGQIRNPVVFRRDLFACFFS